MSQDLVAELRALATKAGGDGRVELNIAVDGDEDAFRVLVMGPGGHQWRFDSTQSTEDVLSKAAAVPFPT